MYVHDSTKHMTKVESFLDILMWISYIYVSSDFGYLETKK